MSDSVSLSNRLFWALKAGDVEGCVKAVADGANVLSRGQELRTPIMLAIATGELACATALSEWMSAEQLGAFDERGRSALYFAIKHGHNELALKLVDRGASISQVTTEASALVSSINDSDGSLVAPLLARGADPLARGGREMKSPFWFALSTGSESAAKVLLPLCDLGEVHRGMTLLMMACRTGNMEAASYLMSEEEALKVDEDGLRVIDHALDGKGGNLTELLTLLLPYSGAFTPDKDGWTVIEVIAARRPRVARLERLVEWVADRMAQESISEIEQVAVLSRAIGIAKSSGGYDVTNVLEPRVQALMEKLTLSASRVGYEFGVVSGKRGPRI